MHTYKGHTKLHFPCVWFGNVTGVRCEWRSLLLIPDDWLVTRPVESGEVCQENMSTIWIWFTLLALSSFAAWSPCLFQVLSLQLTCALRSSHHFWCAQCSSLSLVISHSILLLSIFFLMRDVAPSDGIYAFIASTNPSPLGSLPP